MFDYYKNHGLFNVFSDDLVHENPLIMFKLGSLVAQSFGAFFSPKPLDLQLASEGLDDVLKNVRIVTPDCLKYADESMETEGRASSHSAPPLRF